MKTVERWRAYWESKTEDDPIAMADYYIDGQPMHYQDYQRLIVAPNISLLSLDSECSVLEIGCGTGMHLLEVEKLTDGFVAGTDLSASLLASYKGRALIEKAEAIKQPFQDSSFDRILMVGVTMYFPDIDYFRKAIHEITRLLKNDGVAVVGDLLLGSWTSKSGYTVFPSNEIIDLLNEFNFAWSLQNQNLEKRSLNKRFNIVIRKDVA